MLRFVVLAGLLFGGSGVSASQAESAAADLKPEAARVVWIHDGDTITVDRSGTTEKVRLVGIDTPEVDDERPEFRAAAYAARDYARSRLKGKTVTLEPDRYQPDRDGYGRLLRYVILDDGSDFNDEMVRKGYARVYDRFRFASKPRFKSSEGDAKRKGLGVWTLPPGKWRSSSTF
ncbi:MAG TPA: thermonuclease family protein [Candidatus Polarisedimenticolaceae bacterium]|nr:thermonuclease family protein [Candidatus Polarisedimenticolaceae bacterium]